MARGDKWPSRWWFWSFPAVANLYILSLVLLALLHSFAFRIPAPLQEPVAYPLGLFQRTLGDRVLEAFEVKPFDFPQGTLLVLATYELAAVVVGLVAYGGALLVHAIVGEPGREGEGNSDG